MFRFAGRLAILLRGGGRHAHRLFACLVAAGTVFLPRESLSENGSADVFALRYAVVFESGEPVTGTASCMFGKTCSLIAGAPVKIDILVSKRSDGRHVSDKLVIDCKEGCSFASGRPIIPISGQRRFVFFDGTDLGGVHLPLVYRRKEKLGEIFLIYPRQNDHGGQRQFETP